MVKSYGPLIYGYDKENPPEGPEDGMPVGPCEDAPCCGCCGRDLYGNDAWAEEEPAYCDICGWAPCRCDDWDDAYEDLYDEE